MNAEDRKERLRYYTLFLCACQLFISVCSDVSWNVETFLAMITFVLMGYYIAYQITIAPYKADFIKNDALSLEPLVHLLTFLLIIVADAMHVVYTATSAVRRNHDADTTSNYVCRLVPCRLLARKYPCSLQTWNRDENMASWLSGRRGSCVQVLSASFLRRE